MDSETKTLFDGGSAATIERMASGEASSPTPLRVGRYFISRQIAEGGMGRVLLGYDETLSRKLAIKLWRPQASRGEDLRARMLREAQALARLSHPNVVHVYEVGDHRDLLYLAMEYVEGRTLREWVKQDRPELPRIVERYVQAGQGLAAAHRAGVLHRDFKPKQSRLPSKASPSAKRRGSPQIGAFERVAVCPGVARSGQDGPKLAKISLAVSRRQRWCCRRSMRRSSSAVGSCWRGSTSRSIAAADLAGRPSGRRSHAVGAHVVAGVLRGLE